MDYSKTFSIGDFKASSTSAYAIDESKTLESHRFAPEPPDHHPHHGGKVITDADWPALKPIIQRLYIIDKLTFLKLKEALNLEFGYNITKRQFTRKVESWGFKKNFRKSERDELVKSGKIPQRFIHDSRINQKRVERLQKRNSARMGLGVESEDNERSLVQGQDFSPKTNAIKEASLDLTPCHIMIGHQNAALDDRDMIIEEIPRSELRHDIVAPNTDDQWPFSQSAEDYSGHSWLAELFVQLETAEIITSTSIDNKTEQGVEEYHEAEATIRPVMQIALVALGPNHQLTIRVINLLCWILRKNGSLAEAERLARALLKQNEASKAVDMLKGIQNSPYANGSKKIFIEVEFKVVLGNALWKQGSVWEAIVCFKESLKSTVKMYGWDHSIVFVHCKMIVNWFLQLSQYDEALKFFERFLEKCRGFVKQGSSVAGWIEETEDRMCKVRGGIEDDDNSISEDGYEEDEACFEDAGMKDYCIHEQDDDDEAQFEGRGPRLDEIFNTERDISKDITFEELGLDKDILT
ncbi:putative kinesin light chain protein [Botrytis fragariae]|uniref:Putative kinesin light chain protein n=1 Tax=Botrytis fragariae TaxID=1964551 RepID=A0A8H6AJ14_9HELO|nr:putative kinesin light chain protein [Botrytis fragariae]KAF5868205.1 putative kinesin light chain protein [Botrytis fragariae]